MGGALSPCCRSRADPRKQEALTRVEEKPESSPGWAPLPAGSSPFKKVGCCGALSTDPKKPNYANYIYTLEKHLANSYYLTGGCCLDYLLFVCNWHPLLGIFFCHPNHPWSKAERLTMLLISLSITVVPAAWIARYEGVVQANVQANSSLNEIPLIGEIPVWAYPYLFITLPDCVIGSVLYQLAIQETRKCCCCEGACHKFFECLKNILMLVCLVLGVAGTYFAYVLLKDGNPATDWTDLVKPLGKGYAVSWSVWFVTWTILPCELGFISNWRAGPPEVKEPLALE